MSSNKQNVTFTEDELTQFRDLFQTYDKNKDGRVDAQELHALTKSLGEPATAEELDFVVKSFDANHDGALDYQEFLNLMTTLRSVGRE
ncbi:hypothetical protein EMPS_09157 [Entomortierella parvispora]|uniref:EF-hand domain-containing protein n=1 Tax=Entomortierella parvispora TaxID=205924 RepID=A0A9P3HHR4_9FUNG|nr:hypothetical protein EMPS_09157 [Entomortierella parvispora]